MSFNRQLQITAEQFISIFVTFFECSNSVISQLEINKVLSNLFPFENKEYGRVILGWSGGRFNLHHLLLLEVCVCWETGLVLCDTNSKVYRWELLAWPPLLLGTVGCQVSACQRRDEKQHKGRGGGRKTGSSAKHRKEFSVSRETTPPPPRTPQLLGPVCTLSFQVCIPNTRKHFK